MSKELLKQVLQSVINEDQDQAEKHLHDYLVSKMKTLGEEQEPESADSREHIAIEKFAAQAHEQWRKGFDEHYAETGEVSKARMKKNSDGTEADIHQPFHKIHPDWQKENRAAGQAALEAVKQHPTDLEKAAEFVHDEWMKRNPKAAWNEHQHVPYHELSDEEKQKDRDQVKLMHKLLGNH